MTDINILSVEECYDKTYGESIVQYKRDDGLVSFCFSTVPETEALKNPELLLPDIQKNHGFGIYPLWSDLSTEILDIIKDSAFDMNYIEYGEEDWTQEKANKIWQESLANGLDSVVIAGVDDCYLTVYAGAIGSVNWAGHSEYGKPCLMHDLSEKEKQKMKKMDLSDRIKEAEGKSGVFSDKETSFNIQER